jgi:hypothetical protein
MIYVAAMSPHILEHKDFFQLIGHNMDQAGNYYNGRIDLIGKHVEEGELHPFLFRMADDSYTINDLTFVVVFNRTNIPLAEEERDEFQMAAHVEEIINFSTLLAGKCRPTSIEDYRTANGNYVWIFRNIQDTAWMEEQFTKNIRDSFKLV